MFLQNCPICCCWNVTVSCDALWIPDAALWIRTCGRYFPVHRGLLDVGPSFSWCFYWQTSLKWVTLWICCLAHVVRIFWFPILAHSPSLADLIPTPHHHSHPPTPSKTPQPGCCSLYHHRTNVFHFSWQPFIVNHSPPSQPCRHFRLHLPSTPWILGTVDPEYLNSSIFATFTPYVRFHFAPTDCKCLPQSVPYSHGPQTPAYRPTHQPLQTKTNFCGEKICRISYTWVHMSPCITRYHGVFVSQRILLQSVCGGLHLATKEQL